MSCVVLRCRGRARFAQQLELAVTQPPFSFDGMADISVYTMRVLAARHITAKTKTRIESHFIRFTHEALSHGDTLGRPLCDMCRYSIIAIPIAMNEVSTIFTAHEHTIAFDGGDHYWITRFLAARRHETEERIPSQHSTQHTLISFLR